MSAPKIAEYIGSTTDGLHLSRSEHFKTKGNKLITVVFTGYAPWRTDLYRGNRLLDTFMANADSEGVKYITSRNALERHGYRVRGAFDPLFGEDKSLYEEKASQC